MQDALVARFRGISLRHVRLVLWVPVLLDPVRDTWPTSCAWCVPPPAAPGKEENPQGNERKTDKGYTDADTCLRAGREAAACGGGGCGGGY